MTLITELVFEASSAALQVAGDAVVAVLGGNHGHPRPGDPDDGPAAWSDEEADGCNRFSW